MLVDPTSADGETALDALEQTDDHVSLVVLISGRSSSALREFAEIEGIDPTSAASIYLDQVAERIARDGRIVEVIVATGPDPAIEIADLVASARHATGHPAVVDPARRCRRVPAAHRRGPERRGLRRSRRGRVLTLFRGDREATEGASRAQVDTWWSSTGGRGGGSTDPDGQPR